jgi:hypothetical protein
MTRISLFLLVLLVGCRVSQNASTLGIREARITNPPVGQYRTQHELRDFFDITVDFLSNGSFLASGASSGVEGTVSGRWERHSLRIMLHPEALEGELSSYLDLFEMELDPYREDVIVMNPKGSRGGGVGVITYPFLRRVVEPQ